MDLHLQIYRDRGGALSIAGLPRQPVAHFADLSEGLQYARRECAAAPAVIEFRIDGLYMVVYQARGWPQQLCRPAHPAQPAQIGDRPWYSLDRLGFRSFLSFRRKTRASLCATR
jgi:hypothetical protein